MCVVGGEGEQKHGNRENIGGQEGGPATALGDKDGERAVPSRAEALGSLLKPFGLGTQAGGLLSPRQQGSICGQQFSGT